MNAGERYAIETIVRRAVPPLAMVALAALMLIGARWMPPLIIGALVARPLSRTIKLSSRVRVVASAKGLRMGKRFVPRRALGRALMKHEDGSTYVAFRGRANVDVEVPNNIEGDALVRALGLDAASVTLDVALSMPLSDKTFVALVAAAALTAVTIMLLRSALWLKAVIAGAVLTSVLISKWLATRVVLRIGADGLVLARPLRRDRFLPHDAIHEIRAGDDSISVHLEKGEALVFRVTDITSEGDSDEERQLVRERRMDEIAAIVRRISQAQREFRDHRSAPETIAAVLDRGQRSAREWLAELRRVGEGAMSTFRTMSVARSQLFDLVESTTANASDRIAAAIALRAQLTKEERPRIRVAAEQCAQDDLRSAMLRVLETKDDGELEELIDEFSRTHR